MAESPRLSTLIAISRSEDRVWPLNAALMAFGGTILWIVFRYLKPDDPRWLHNPWFYAIVTPIGLLLLSIILSALVSRVVERSVQLAFLLSLIVHLVLLVFAVDIVIFSRLWPDVFEDIQRQRVTLKQQQNIPQYFHLAASSLGNRRPDYLRYVPTKHRPTEVDPLESKLLQLARAEHAELATPEPKLQSSAKAFSIERDQPSLTLPPSAQEAAPMSRSELADQLNVSRLMESIPSSTQPASQPEPLQPADAAIARKQQRPTRSPTFETNQPAFEPHRDSRIEPSSLARSEPKLEPMRSASSSPLPRDLQQFTPSLPQSQNIDTSFAAAATASPRSNSKLEPQEPDRRAKMPKSATLELTSVREAPLVPRVLQPNIDRATASQVEMPLLESGDLENSIRAKTAGGQTGLAAALSMPVRGLPSAAALSTAPSAAPSTVSDLSNRRSALERTNSRMPASGVSQSPEWSQALSFAEGKQGAAAVSLPERATSGQASTPDVAGLVGDDSPLTRSAVGLAPTRSSTGIPTAVIVSDIDGIAGVVLQSDQSQTVESPQPLSAQAADVGRSSQPKETVLAGHLPPSASSSETLFEKAPGVPPLARAARDFNPTPDSAALDRASAVERQKLQSLADATPSSPVPLQGRIEDVPTVPAGDQRQTVKLSPTESLRNRPGSSALSGQIVLSVDAELGQGGVAIDRDSRGPLLARNDDTTLALKVAEIESNRFARKDIGGPLASGMNVPVPKPAFQQRIDRLKDESLGNQTLVGPQTEIAIERGLMFLAKYQRADGSWRLQDFDTPVLIRSDTAAVGLSLLAFQGAGYTHRQFKHAQAVDRALKFLVAHQLPNGDLYIPQDPASDQNAWLYSHSIATLALCEAFGMTQDEQLREPAQKAVQFMVASQDPQRGGWRYRPGSGTDTSVTGWFTMALKSARLAGLSVPDETFDRLKLFLDASRVSKDQPYMFRYNPFAPDTDEQRHGLQPTAVMTSVGLLMRFYFGWQRNQPEMIAGADHLLDNPPRSGTRSKSLRDTYYWYYATQVLFHMGGERWKKWHSHLHPILIQDQIQDGELAGSWDPFLPTADLWARYGGRLYVTTMNLLSLEVNYRHLPLYEATAK